MESKDNKNAIIAVVLSGIILFGWNYFFAPAPLEPAPVSSVANTVMGTTNSEKVDGSTTVDDGSIAQNTKNQKSTFVTFENENVKVTLNDKLELINILNYNGDYDLNKMFIDHSSKFFITTNNQKHQPSFKFTKISNTEYEILDANIGLSGHLTLNEKNFLVLNLKSASDFLPEMHLISTKVEVDDERKANSFILLGDGLERVAVGSEDRESFEFKFKWFGLDFNYFFYGYVLDTDVLYKAEALKNTLKIAPIGPVKNFNFSIVFLKKNYDELLLAGSNLDKTVDFGMWEVIAVPILHGLQYFYEVFKNYGLAIIFLTILMRFLTFPLQYKSFKSMKKMQVIQPELKIIKEKYKDNPQKVQQETMALFKKAGANPLGGCLPMLLQMPIFFAFYKVLFTSVELVDAPFYFWIADLSEKDPFYVLPVLMGLAMFLNMKLTPSTATDPAQQKVMMLMPVMFSIFMINLPAGLTLYILVSTIVGMLQQLFVFKRTT